MSVELGANFGASSTGRVDIGSFAIPSLVTHFVWFMRTGEGGGSFGRILGRSTGTHDITNDHGSFANNYAFGDRAGGQYHRWTRLENIGEWSSILVSGNTSNNSVAPRILQNGRLVALTRVGAANYWSGLSSAATVIGNRQSDNIRTWDGYIAHYCMWDAILNEYEEEQLVNGVPPHLVRPNNLVKYYPLDSDYSPVSQNANAISARYTKVNPPIYRKNNVIYLFGLPAGSNDILISTAPASLTLAGVQAGVNLGHTISTTPSSLSLAGVSASINLGNTIAASPASLALTGMQAGVQLNNDILINTTPSNLALTGLTAGVSLGSNILIGTTPASLTLTGLQAGVNLGASISASVGSLTLTGTQANVTLDSGITINCAIAQLSLTGLQAGVDLGNTIACNPASMLITGRQAGIGISQSIACNVAQLTLSGAQALVRLDTSISAIAASLSLSGVTAQVSSGGVFPVISSQSIDMTGYYANIAMTNYTSSIDMDATGESIGTLQ